MSFTIKIYANFFKCVHGFLGFKVTHYGPVYMRFSSPVRRAGPFYRVGSTPALFPRKIFVVLICKGGLARLPRSLFSNRDLGKRASPPSHINTTTIL